MSKKKLPQKVPETLRDEFGLRIKPKVPTTRFLSKKESDDVCPSCHNIVEGLKDGFKFVNGKQVTVPKTHRCTPGSACHSILTCPTGHFDHFDEQENVEKEHNEYLEQRKELLDLQNENEKKQFENQKLQMKEQIKNINNPNFGKLTEESLKSVFKTQAAEYDAKEDKNAVLEAKLAELKNRNFLDNIDPSSFDFSNDRPQSTISVPQYSTPEPAIDPQLIPPPIVPNNPYASPVPFASPVPSFPGFPVPNNPFASPVPNNPYASPVPFSAFPAFPEQNIFDLLKQYQIINQQIADYQDQLYQLKEDMKFHSQYDDIVGLKLFDESNKRRRN